MPDDKSAREGRVYLRGRNSHTHTRRWAHVSRIMKDAMLARQRVRESEKEGASRREVETADSKNA